MSDNERERHIIYILVFPQSDRTRIRVVDFDKLSDWKYEFALVNENEYDTLEEAQFAAQDIAERHGLTCVSFDRRYTVGKYGYLY